jgi:uncharacterized protein (DUF433 family)
MDAIKVDREILGGTPCFASTRVPVKSLFDYIEDGYSIDYFLDQFPAVKREQVISVLESSRLRAEADAKSSAS